MKNPTVMLSRELLAATYLEGDGIEVGALQAPLRLPPEARVEYVDRMPNAQLYQHYPELGDLPLVDVDVIDNGETLSSFADHSLDFVVANHFLEHCEDPIGTLRTFLRVLRLQGVIYAAVPDKRFTFDRDRPTTPLSHLLRDHEQGPQASRMEHFEEWARFVEPNFGRIYGDDEKIRARADELSQMDYSIHFHNWTPADFMELINHCVRDRSFPMTVDLFVALGEEMIVVLRRTA